MRPDLLGHTPQVMSHPPNLTIGTRRSGSHGNTKALLLKDLEKAGEGSHRLYLLMRKTEFLVLVRQLRAARM